MNITTIGLDVAKSVFQVHGVNQQGKAVLRKRLKRADVVNFFAKLLPCLIGMEACGSAHYWARKLGELGHTVKLMAPQFVKPYVKTNKNDARDAEAICEAVSCVASSTFRQTVSSEMRDFELLRVARRRSEVDEQTGISTIYGGTEAGDLA
jgi:transposase